MDRYLCITCATEFKNKKLAQKHKDCFYNHHVCGKTLKGRLIDYLCDNFKTLWRMIGVYIFLGVLVSHFKFSFTEVILLAISLGMLI